MTEPRRVLIYCRISQDRKPRPEDEGTRRERTGAGLGVERQEEDCRVLAARLGWTVVAPALVDNDVSAYSGKARPAYRELLAALESGRADAVIAWHPDRLHRSPRELETFIDIAERRGIAVQTCRAGEIDLNTAAGRAIARTLGAWARAESETKSERLRRQRQQLAESGGWHGGPRPFGFEKDGTTVNEPEAAVIRDAVAGLLAGESLRSVQRRANASGLLTTFGREDWAANSFRAMLLRPRNAGLRAHRGTVIGPAVWAPIISPEQHHAVVAILTDPDRRTSPGNAVRYLGSGLYVCAPCGSTVWVQGSSTGRRGPAYRCRQATGTGHVTRAQEPVDRLIEGLIVKRLSAPDAADLVTSGTATPADLAALRTEATAARRRISELEEMLGAGELSRAGFGAAMVRADERLTAAEKTLTEAAGTSPLVGLAGAPDIATRWPVLDLGRRRAVLADLMTVTLLPIRGGRYFDPAGVAVAWHRD